MRCKKRFTLLLLILVLLFTATPVVRAGEKAVDRFFLAGDGKIRLKNEKNGREIAVSFIAPDGTLDRDAVSAIEEIFGFTGKEREVEVSLRLLFMLDHFSDLVAKGRVIHLHSGYRNPGHNSRLKKSGGNVARTSTHIDGMAIDFSIDGVSGKKLWELIRSKNCCGVGHYGGDMIHLDSGKPRFWEAATSKVTTGQSDHNRRIYLSTEYDRYRPGERVLLSLSSVSDYGFGVGRDVRLEGIVNGATVRRDIRLEKEGTTTCILVDTRKGGRLLPAFLPADLPPGRFRITMEFCGRPWEAMPPGIMSNEIEVTAD